MRIFSSKSDDVYKASVKLVHEVRKELSEKYNIKEGEHKDYTGLCDEACILFINKFKSIGMDKNVIDIKSVHGEQKHSISIASEFWIFKHTWIEISMPNKLTFHVDPTSQQFKWLYDDIPDWFVLFMKPPKWYLKDKHNFRWSKIGVWLNDHIYFKKKIYDKKRNEYDKVKNGIVEFLQYDIYGLLISDFIRSHKLKKEN